MFEGFFEFPVEEDPDIGSGTSSGSEVASLGCELKISVAAGFADGFKVEGDPSIGVDAEESVAIFGEVDAAKGWRMLAGNRTVAYVVPGFAVGGWDTGDGEAC